MAEVFEKMMVGINRGISVVSESSKIMIQKAHLNTEMQNMEKSKERIYGDIGKLVCSMQAAGEIDIEQCKDMCEEVINLDNRMREIQIQLQNLELQKNGFWGYSDNQVVDSSEYIVCDCGYNNRKESKFCARCGKQIKE